MSDFAPKSNRELLKLYTELMAELRNRGIVRTSNGPGADVAEGLVAKALSLTLNTSSTAGYDGIDPQGRKIEVKCRRLTSTRAETSCLRIIRTPRSIASSKVCTTTLFGKIPRPTANKINTLRLRTPAKRSAARGESAKIG